MKSIQLVVISLLCALLVNCGGKGESTPSLRIAISPAAQQASTAILACIPQEENLSISIDPLYANTFDLGDYDLFVRLGEPAEEINFAAQLAWERILVILNPDLGVSSLSRGELIALFSGRVSAWEEFGAGDLPVSLWVPPGSDEARQIFQIELLQGGPVSGGAHLAADPAQLLAAVTEDAGAIGILPAAWADDNVEQIDLGIQVPLLAVATQEPGSAAAQLIACLQSESGQALLSEQYVPFQP